MFSCLILTATISQTPEIEREIQTRLAAARYVASMYDDTTGGYKPTQDGKPGLRATSAAVRATIHLGGKLANPDKTAKFVMSCYDEKTGGFAEVGEKANTFSTSVGIMAAVELKVPKEQFKKSMDFLKSSVKDFEDVRIAAAGIDAYGVKDSAIPTQDIFDLAAFQLTRVNDGKDDPARVAGSCVAMILRLGGKLPDGKWLEVMQKNQREDGAWGKLGAKDSDLETSYRVMRSLWMLKEKPKNVEGLKKFMGLCRRDDGGFGVDPVLPECIITA